MAFDRGSGSKAEKDLQTLAQTSQQSEPNAQGQKYHAERMPQHDCRSHFLWLYVELVCQHKVEYSRWQACKQYQCATFNGVQWQQLG
jgi:hypothetical protein